MNAYLPFINAFVEDTCVLIVIAYLLARGPLLALLTSDHGTRRRRIMLGLVFGLIGTTEIVFPGARSPYVAHTLIVTLASLTCGMRVALVAAAIVTLSSGILQSASSTIHVALILVCIAMVGEAIRRAVPNRTSLLRAMLAGMTAQSVVILLNRFLAAPMRHTTHPLSGSIGVAANGFGLMMIQLILNDAQTRDASEQNLLEVERSKALVAEAQLAALRARVHPHFLFNALTSIAALCSLSPVRAEAAILRLGQLMHRALEANPSGPVDLTDEIEIVRAYLEIEQHRLGKRLKVVWDLDSPMQDLTVPAFVLQTLVENAVIHGIAPMMYPGVLRVVVRFRARYTLIAVSDSGIGMSQQARTAAIGSTNNGEHGLQIAAGQLRILYGKLGRLRIYTRPDAGTSVVFAIPNVNATAKMEKRS